MKKSLFTIVLASTLLLTACGTSNGKKESETTTATITTSETETTTTAEVTTTASEETTTETTKAESGTPESIATTVGKPDGYPSIEEVQNLLSEKIKLEKDTKVTPTTMPVYDPYILGFRSLSIQDCIDGKNQYVMIFIFQFDTNSTEYKNLVVGEKFNLTSVNYDQVSNDPQVVTAINGPYVLTILNIVSQDNLDYGKDVAPFKYSNSQAIYDAFVALNK